MTRWNPVRLGVVAVSAVALTAAMQASASADAAPGANDVVGVGSDIVQNSLDFLADGDALGNDGYNTAGNKYRLISFDATADGNGRNAYTDPSLGTPGLLNPTVTLRAGTSPVQRPNGGGAGLTALVNDGVGGTSANRINFVRSPNLPTQAQQAAAQTNLGSPLYSIQFATDKQVIATASTTNAPKALSAQDLLCIYSASGTCTHWNDLPDAPAGASTDAIIPLIPQSGAGVRTIFLNALAQVNGGQQPTLGASVRPVQQNDPTTITGLSPADQKNAIVPFPIGRYNLLKSGYFKNPATPYSVANPPAALSADGIKLHTTGKTSDNKPAFSATLPYYVIFRESDLNSSTPWQPGSTLNWVQELFANPGGATPFIKSQAAVTLLKANGLTPSYVDKGEATSD